MAHLTHGSAGECVPTGQHQWGVIASSVSAQWREGHGALQHIPGAHCRHLAAKPGEDLQTAQVVCSASSTPWGMCEVPL